MLNVMMNWRPTSLSELTPVIFKVELTHLDSDASNYYNTLFRIVSIFNWN